MGYVVGYVVGRCKVMISTITFKRNVLVQLIQERDMQLSDVVIKDGFLFNEIMYFWLESLK